MTKKQPLTTEEISQLLPVPPEGLIWKFDKNPYYPYYHKSAPYRFGLVKVINNEETFVESVVLADIDRKSLKYAKFMINNTMYKQKQEEKQLSKEEKILAAEKRKNDTINNNPLLGFYASVKELPQNN
jgi:hypothetical protein